MLTRRATEPQFLDTRPRTEPSVTGDLQPREDYGGHLPGEIYFDEKEGRITSVPLRRRKHRPKPNQVRRRRREAERERRSDSP